jgi:hypothetical protein
MSAFMSFTVSGSGSKTRTRILRGAREEVGAGCTGLVSEGTAGLEKKKAMERGGDWITAERGWPKRRPERDEGIQS